MTLPSLTVQDVAQIVPAARDICTPLQGGQKLVFPCVIEDAQVVIKFLLINEGRFPQDDQPETTDEVTIRASREVSILGQCESPNIVKLGPIPLTRTQHRGQDLLYFTEERIDGEDLRLILRRVGTLRLDDLLLLAEGVSAALETLERHNKVHRDIKPGNVMRRSATGEFVLLDMGLVFDPFAAQITSTGQVPGTLAYFSPEQFDFAHTRQLDSRSDMFALGVLLYESATGSHPFVTSIMSSSFDVMAGILNTTPRNASIIRQDLPATFAEIIMRLLAKHPHLRYRDCTRLRQAIQGIFP